MSLKNHLSCLVNHLVEKAELASIISRVSELEHQVQSLLNPADSVPEKEWYEISDLANLLCKDASTLRKNFVKTGLIKTEFRGKRYFIHRDEFKRVKDLYHRHGYSRLDLVLGA